MCSQFVSQTRGLMTIFCSIVRRTFVKIGIFVFVWAQTRRPIIYQSMDFAAIDFETANQCPSSVCSVGLVVVRQGEIADRYYSLICPEPEYYSYFCTRVHGLTLEDTVEAPSFAEVWERADHRIGGLPLVAHNARFDRGCLEAAFEIYGMGSPRYEWYDTLQASRRAFGRRLPNHQLQTVAAACGYDMRHHHHAQADAEACARIAIALEQYLVRR